MIHLGRQRGGQCPCRKADPPQAEQSHSSYRTGITIVQERVGIYRLSEQSRSIQRHTRRKQFKLLEYLVS